MTRTKARHIRRLRIAVRDPIVSRAHDFSIDLDVDPFARWGNFFDGCLHKNRDRRSEFRGRHRDASDLRSLTSDLWFMVRKGGLEPPHLSVPDPKSGASANSATFAKSTTYKQPVWCRFSSLV